MNRGRRPLYVERVGWVGFGRADPQLDLFESTWRCGWWRVSVCRVCIITAIQVSRERIENALGNVEKRLRERDGQ